jgi:protein TonB
MVSAHPAAPAVLSGSAAATSISSVTPAATAPQATAEAHAPATTEAGFTADYLHNPAPAYPPAARRNGEEGRVLLRVLVSAAGQAEAVDIQHSSGFPGWTKRPEKPWPTGASPRHGVVRRLASTVIVPVTFRLGH